ncbi:ribosome biogenesis GTP-binding protein YihA/YsxC [Helicobacter himalayensis]|uniref:ribosome biogenesis GTP-binding protein YihA/YsxC n=1 Tax=Helicobacter himalayensis TaxID=1591088 RepID=UPI000832BD33|nr:ribosome biogenesis GTP-binding protein YihA/YsxC [Helicobacter himalayensis]
MQVLSINPHFLLSAQNITQAPSPLHSEIAFLGRSNVGKSSFLNLLLGANLAKSSSTPGKTQFINFFSTRWEIRESPTNTQATQELVFIDLPGFGYAKVSKSLQEKWQRDLVEFLQRRNSIKLFVFLRDSRHVDLAKDDAVLEFLQGIKRGDQEILNIFTKADKLNKSALNTLKSQGAILSSINPPKKIQHKISSVSMLRFMIFQKVLGKMPPSNQQQEENDV